MAQGHQTQLADGLDRPHPPRTVRFAINDEHYEVDLTTSDLVGFKQALSRYLTVARPEGAGAQQRWDLFPVTPVNPVPAVQAPAPTPEVLPEPTFDGSEADMRLWAQHKRMVLGPRGRIPREIEHAYSAAAKRSRQLA